MALGTGSNWTTRKAVSMTNKEYTAWLNREYLKQEPWPELTGKTVAEMFQGRPGFKAQSHRTINGTVAKPKRFRVPIPARRGLNSILGEYTTGRNVKVTKYNWSTGFNYDPDGVDKPRRRTWRFTSSRKWKSAKCARSAAST